MTASNTIAIEAKATLLDAAQCLHATGHLRLAGKLEALAALQGQATGDRDGELLEALRTVRDIALSHSNYGHVEGNHRAFAILDDLSARITTIKRARKTGERQ